MLERGPDPERRGRPKYILTDKGRELGPALILLMKWGDRHYPTPKGPPRLTLHAGCGGTIGSDFRCERCGKAVAPGELDLPPGPGAPRARRAAPGDGTGSAAELPASLRQQPVDMGWQSPGERPS